MTKEEAIKIFRHKIETMEDGAISSNYGTDKDAFALAIKMLEQEPCDDCISRQAVLDALDKSKYSNEFCEEHHIDWSINLGMAHIVVNKLKPVTPKQKTGHWIPLGNYDDFGNESSYKCSECGDLDTYPDNFCPNCGARMTESEDT